METLKIDRCDIKELPETMAKLTKLKELALIRLPIDKFPDIITKISSLEKLEFSQKTPIVIVKDNKN